MAEVQLYARAQLYDVMVRFLRGDLTPGEVDEFWKNFSSTDKGVNAVADCFREFVLGAQQSGDHASCIDRNRDGLISRLLFLLSDERFGWPWEPQGWWKTVVLSIVLLLAALAVFFIPGSFSIPMLTMIGAAGLVAVGLLGRGSRRRKEDRRMLQDVWPFDSTEAYGEAVDMHISRLRGDAPLLFDNRRVF